MILLNRSKSIFVALFCFMSTSALAQVKTDSIENWRLELTPLECSKSYKRAKIQLMIERTNNLSLTRYNFYRLKSEIREIRLELERAYIDLPTDVKKKLDEAGKNMNPNSRIVGVKGIDWFTNSGYSGKGLAKALEYAKAGLTISQVNHLADLKDLVGEYERELGVGGGLYTPEALIASAKYQYEKAKRIFEQEITPGAVLDFMEHYNKSDFRTCGDLLAKSVNPTGERPRTEFEEKMAAFKLEEAYRKIAPPIPAELTTSEIVVHDSSYDVNVAIPLSEPHIGVRAQENR